MLTFTSVRPSISLFFRQIVAIPLSSAVWDTKVNVFLSLKRSNQDSLWVVIFCSLACFFLLTALMCVHHGVIKLKEHKQMLFYRRCQMWDMRSVGKKRAMSKKYKNKEEHLEIILWQTNVLFCNNLSGKCKFYFIFLLIMRLLLQKVPALWALQYQNQYWTGEKQKPFFHFPLKE